MKKNPVGWFEIPVDDMPRARAFYQAVFQTTLEDMDMPGTEMATFPMIPGGENSSGALIKAEGYQPSKVGSIVYFVVDDCTDPLSRIEANGGEILVPKMSIGEYGFIAHFIDTEGNRVAIHSMK